MENGKRGEERARRVIQRREGGGYGGSEGEQTSAGENPLISVAVDERIPFLWWTH